MDDILRRNTISINIAIVFFWIGFFYVWGFLGWNDIIPSEEEWWFDNAGHAIFGIGGALTLLHNYLNYSLQGHFYFGGRKLLIKNIVGDVALGAILWEVGEFLYDSLLRTGDPKLPMAQLSAKDTTLDITLAVSFSIITLIIYYWCNKAYEKKYLEVCQKEEAKMLEELIRDFGQQIAQKKKEHRIKLRGSLFKILKNRDTKK